MFYCIYLHYYGEYRLGNPGTDMVQMDMAGLDMVQMDIAGWQGTGRRDRGGYGGFGHSLD